MATLFGCTDIDGRSCNDCPEIERQKIVHVALVQRGTTIDKTSQATIISSILAAELACNGYVIRNVSGEYDGGALTEGAGPGKSISRIVGGTHQVTFTDFDYVANAAFWNGAKDASQNYTMWYFTDSKGWEVPFPLTIMPKPAFGRDNQLFIEADITIKWSSKDHPLPYDANVDSLAECPELFVQSYLTEWTAGSGDQSVIDGFSLKLAQDDILNVSVDTGVDLSSVTDVNSTLPSGITATVSDQDIILSGSTSATAGDYSIVLRASNTCGVSGELTFTLTII